MTSPAPTADLLGLYPEELSEMMPEDVREPYRVAQLLSWMYDHGVRRFADMTNLPRSFRRRAQEAWRVGSLERERETTSADGDATKYLWRLEDGQRIESVYLVLPTRETFCISSQVGCAYGCTFCATARMGFRRNLTSREILEQVYWMREELRRRRGADRPPYNVVFMGMGEPLANYDAVVDGVRRLTHPKLLGLSERRITISTCGLANQIRRLADEGLRVGLAISLNATTDETRVRTMPVTRKHGIDELCDAAATYAGKTGRRVTFEYVLLRGTNDGTDDIARLSAIAARVPCKLNVIPFNPFPDAGHERPDDRWVTTFLERLMGSTDRAVTMRTTRGLDIAAACGQLATGT